MNICGHLTATARIFPQREAIRFEGTSFTYAFLNEMSLAASQRLLAAGIQPGDRVAIMLANVPGFVVWYYAALRIGAIAVSVSTRSTPSEVAFLVTDCNARFFVADSATVASVSDELPDCVVETVSVSDSGDSCSGEDLVCDGSAESGCFDAHHDDPAVILYTSGTTGFPKGATLSHMNVRSNACAFNHLCNMRPHDRILLAVPLFHCFGQNALMNSALNVGATLVMQRRFDPGESRQLIVDERVTQLYGVPMMFQLFLDSCSVQDLATVNYCFSAAATLPVQVSDEWQRKFGMPLNEGYGLTETSPFASYNHRLQFVRGSIGTPIDAVEMKVVDTETGDECSPGTLGEIIVRGPNVMLGYWNRPEDTANAICRGWFHSGDIGRVDHDGFFYIVDRVKDMIVVGGLKVFPAEVERVLLDHSVVSQVAVVGVQDTVFGEQVVAFVVLNEEATEESIQSIRDHAKAYLAGYKTPRAIVPIDELPRNPSGKVLKRELKNYDIQELDTGDTANDIDQSPANAQLREPTLRRELESTHAANRRRTAIAFIQNLIQNIADTDHPPNADQRFLDAGMDSLMIVEMGKQLQMELGSEHDIPPTLLFDYPRISDLCDYLVSVLFPDESNNVSQMSESASGVFIQQPDIEDMSEEEALEELMKELKE